MKKFLAIILTFAFLAGLGVSAGAASITENAVFELNGLSIGVPGENLDESVTRAEFAHLIAELLGVSQTNAAASQNYYSDVDPNSKYASDIAILSQMGIINGVGENSFAPNEKVGYEQAVKVLVVCLGYDSVAQSGGGYPGGYLAVASKNGILKSVQLESPLTRRNLYIMMYNALDVEILTQNISTGSSQTLEKAGETLRDRIVAGSEYYYYKGTGVISANAFTYTETPIEDLKNDEVVINSVIFKVGKTNAFDLLGYEVNYYAREIGDTYELLSVQKTEHGETVEIDAEDFGSKSGNTIYYTNESGKGAKLSLASSGVKVVYNGSRILYPTDSVFEIENGTLTFFDNDDQSGYELCLINEYVNAVADKFDGEQFWFINDCKYMGASSLFVGKDDEDVKMIVTDENGKNSESFEGEKNVSIFKNNDSTRYRVIVSDKVIKGTVEAMSYEEITLDGAEYKKAGALGFSPRLGEEYTLFIDYMGKISFGRTEKTTDYAYILNYGRKNDFSPVQAELLLPGIADFGVDVNEEDVTDTQQIPFLILENKDKKILDFAKNVKCGGVKYSESELMTLLASPSMRVISYTLNDEGKISKFEPLSNYGGNLGQRLQYNVYDKVFGGYEYIDGFAIDEKTAVLCVPNGVADEDDYFVKVNITVDNNNVGYNVAGFDYDELTKKAKLLVAYADMDANQARDVVFNSSKASFVNQMTYIRNEDGEAEPQTEILNAGEKKIFNMIDIGTKNNALGNLKKGDLIAYITNKNDLLENAMIIRSFTAVNDDMRYVSNAGGYTETVGTAGQVERDEVDSLNKILVTKLSVTSSGITYDYMIPQTNKPPIYIYSRGEKTAVSGDFADIRPESDRVYVLERTSDSLIRAIVLIRE